jgi:hypothetical protein
MQLADTNMDSKLYSANIGPFRGRRRQAGTANFRASSDFISRLKTTSASERLLAMLLAAFVVTASPALLTTVRSAVSLSFQILLEAGRAGLIAFQIFGR